MKVKELIEKLQSMPKDANVVSLNDEGYYIYDREVNFVILENNEKVVLSEEQINYDRN